MQKFLSIAGLAFLFASAGLAQSGVVSGVVYGAGDEPESDFLLQIDNVRSGERFETRTNDNGEFRIGALKPGEYAIATDIGQSEPLRFTVTSIQPVEIVIHSVAGGGPPVDQAVEVMSVTLTPAQVSQSFPAGVIDESTQADFINPNGQLYGAYNLSLLTEGIRPPLEFSNIVGPGVAGRPGDANDYSISGIDNNDRTTPGPLLYIPDDATEEFTLHQNGFDPQSTHVTGGAFNSVLRSGANAVHGSGYWYFQNHQLNARDARLDALELQDRPRFSQHRVGGTLGAPIIKDHLFGTVNLEYTPLGLTRYAPGRSLVPTAAGRQLLRNSSQISQRNLALIGSTANASTGTVSVNGVDIPVGLVDAGSLGNRDTIAGSAGLDFVVTPGDRVSARYVQNEIDSSFSGVPVAGVSTPLDRQSILASVAYTHSGTAWWSNQFRLGYTRLDDGYNPNPFEFDDGSDAPLVAIQGIDLNLGAQYPYRNARFNTYHANNNLTMMVGRHDVQVGVDARRIISSQSGFPQFAGAYTYSSLERFLLDQSPDVSAQRAFGDPTLNQNQWLFQGWIQDRYKLASTFTLEAGVRYQWAEVPEFARRQGLNSGLNVADVASFDEPREDTDAFGPRVGIAYSPFQNIVFRAGAGMEFDTLYMSQRLATLLGPQSDVITTSDPLSTTRGFLNGGGVQRPTDARARLSAFIPGQDLPYTIHWNAGVQGSLWKGLTGSVRYIGNKSIHQTRFATANDNGFVNADRSLPVFFRNPSAAELNDLTLTLNDVPNGDPSPEFAAGFTNPIFGLDPVGTATYHAGIVEVNQSLVRGFQMGAQYTLSDLRIDGYGSPLDLGLVGNGRFNAPFNPDHRLTVSGVIDVADMFQSPGIVAKVVANFSIMAAYTYTSDIGLPLSNGLDTGLTGSSAGAAIFENPSGGVGGSGVTPLRNNQGQIVAYRATDPDARFVQGGIGSFSTNRGIMDLDQLHNFDVAAAKKFTFVEDATFEFRVEAYNLLNSQQRTGYAVHGLATPTSIGLPRLTPSQLVPSSPNFGNLGSLFSSNPRTLQLALRLTF
jgi:hypothetical protein